MAETAGFDEISDVSPDFALFCTNVVSDSCELNNLRASPFPAYAVRRSWLRGPSGALRSKGW
jgi:hypothetical protein